MKAKFSGACPSCREKYPKGASIERESHGWVHARCQSMVKTPTTRRVTETRTLQDGELHRSISAKVGRPDPYY
jgi:hypothetical protein